MFTWISHVLMLFPYVDDFYVKKLENKKYYVSEFYIKTKPNQNKKHKNKITTNKKLNKTNKQTRLI